MYNVGKAVNTLGYILSRAHTLLTMEIELSFVHLSLTINIHSMACIDAMDICYTKSTVYLSSKNNILTQNCITEYVIYMLQYRNAPK